MSFSHYIFVTVSILSSWVVYQQTHFYVKYGFTVLNNLSMSIKIYNFYDNIKTHCTILCERKNEISQFLYALLLRSGVQVVSIIL